MDAISVHTTYSLFRHDRILAIREARLHCEGSLLNVPELAHPTTKCTHVRIIRRWRADRHPPDPGNLRNLLRLRQDRPSRRATNQTDELAPLHVRPQVQEMASYRFNWLL
jgi:hypothetical protein